MQYEFEMSQNITESTKNMCGVKDEETADQSKLTRMFKKCSWGLQEARWSRSRCKTINSEVVFPATEANPVSCT